MKEKFSRFLVKIVMFISSYFPLYILLFVLYWNKCNEKSDYESWKTKLFVLVTSVCIILSVISIVLLFMSKNGTKGIKIEEIERPDDTVISYLMTYVIPIVTSNSEAPAILVNVLLFVLIGYFYIRLNLLYLNPLWSIFGYISYRVNTDMIIITNYSYTDLKQMKKENKRIKGIFIANDIFVAKKIKEVKE